MRIKFKHTPFVSLEASEPGWFGYHNDHGEKVVTQFIYVTGFLGFSRLIGRIAPEDTFNMLGGKVDRVQPSNLENKLNKLQSEGIDVPKDVWTAVQAALGSN